MPEKLNVKQLAEQDRPREKMMRHGASALSDAELLAILIGSGNTEDNAVELMRKILNDYGNKLSLLGKCTIDELCRYKGIGTAKAVTILAASELGKRRKNESAPERPQIRSSKDSYAHFHPKLCDLAVEEVWVMLLNQANRLIDTVKISHGGLTATHADIRCILREALLKRATSVILCHNHPSGNISPSAEDDRLTQALSQATRTLDIRTLDHLIVTDGKYYSYADEGKL